MQQLWYRSGRVQGAGPGAPVPGSDLLVRTRAAEFLGLSGLGDPVPVILDALYRSQDEVEALLILNSLVLLMDGPHGIRV